MKRLLPAFIVLILFLGCGGNGDGGNGGPGPMGADACFPLQIGNWWTYAGGEIDALGDSIPGSAYTMFTQVIGDTSISGQDYYVLQDSSNASGFWETEIAQLAQISENAVIFLMSFFEDTVQLQRAVMGILPATIGDDWTVLNLDTIALTSEGDTLNLSLTWIGTVLDYASLSVPAGNFDDCYHLGYTMDFEISTPDTTIAYQMESKIWLAPHVGLTKMTQLPYEGPDGPEPGDYQELLEYSVAP